MAPIIKKGSLARQRTSTSQPTTHHNLGINATRNASLFKSTKKDKRTIKHSSLISRIQKANETTKKRRRPSKKLVTNLESLANALPDADAVKGSEFVTSNARIRHTTLKSRPGAMKKKEKLEKMETERFSRNLAQMAEVRTKQTCETARDSQHADASNEGSSGRWAALRGFIQQTMDRNPPAERS
ncbi:hypothetical protein MMC09_006235 [Bachmanniomyces sp. S44760]|nr:hypothetical protein [Bachmanniomyces sp. S44760]